MLVAAAIGVLVAAGVIAETASWVEVIARSPPMQAASASIVDARPRYMNGAERRVSSRLSWLEKVILFIIPRRQS
ncbi:MAG: hypothetical protein BZY87_02170 [SAR202 cluster bacterium Io17-Chloro-G6]|nr:MAG: hypothetical protein BZY87_02170 [SAR202 cluster bacterium Io17-Chloro-G6]